MTDSAYAPRPIQLPAVLQAVGQAPCFGTTASMSEQGLTFDFHACPPSAHRVGSKAILDFNVLGQHHAFNTLLVHVQGNRALLSLREASPVVLTALHAAAHQKPPPLAATLAVLQRQHACHARFMEGMRAVVDSFYSLLPEAIVRACNEIDSPQARAGYDALVTALRNQRPLFTQQFCQAFPMHPDQRASYAGVRKAEASLDLVDMEQVDDWIRRTTVAQRIDEALAPLPHEFNRHYNALLKNDYTELAHPYRLESVLNVLADLVAPLGINAEQRVFCYTHMGHAFEQHAAALYPALIQVLGVEPEAPRIPSAAGTDLGTWLKAATTPADGESPAGPGVTAAQVDTLAARLAQALEAAGVPPVPAGEIPALSAHDRILARFLPAPLPEREQAAASAASTVGSTLGRLGGLDDTALESLRVQLHQPPPIDPGPERLPDTSQVRELMQQAQGLVLQYTLDGLTYPAQPDHPAWALLNALDALHEGADDDGRFLDPALHRAVSLAMQWLLDQDQPDAALPQVNALLAGLNTELHAARQARRAERLQALGADPATAGAGWCVVRRDGAALPHEIVRADDRFLLFNRSATVCIERPPAGFSADIDAGVIEETARYDQPFLTRTASAALTASLDAVHVYAWKDPASGCLKRSALMDELERRLDHPVPDPPTYCALIEIPTMRPSLTSLPGDELSVLQTRSGECLLAMLEPGEHCGRLSDVAFMVVFAPQDPQRVSDRLARLKGELEGLHPSWKMLGAVVPLVAPDEADPSPSSVLRRANLACAGIRQQAGLELGGLDASVPAAALPDDALPLDSLYLRCQKIQPCTGNAPAHYEILLGLDDSLAPLHSTQSFVVMAEQTGRIQELDAWVLRAVLDWMEHNAVLVAQLSGLSINLSGACIARQAHIDAMAALCAAHPDLSRKLILEVTETSAIDNLDDAARALRTLKKLGCRIALDDFGSGYSSYGYLRQLPLDYLKIDGTYIRNILTDKTDQALTASMVDVAHALGIKVIAEYVDSAATFAWLKDLGVDYVQGYWVHPPQRLDTLALD